MTHTILLIVYFVTVAGFVIALGYLATSSFETEEERHARKAAKKKVKKENKRLKALSANA